MTLKLTAENVEALLLDCLYTDEEAVQLAANGGEGAIMARMITITIGFKPESIEANRTKIADLLRQLPAPFTDPNQGGWSFLNACEDRNGMQWGEHKSMEALFALGMAAGFVKELFPRELWSALPGGMPYYYAILPQGSIH